MGRYYLYRHIREDKNEVFYIGIGTKLKKHYKTLKSEYQRAYSKSRNNDIWNKIINKTKFTVEILMESNNKDFIKNKEKEFINLYGRKNLDKGSLANLTDGGDGSRQVQVSLETKIKMSEAHNPERKLLSAKRLMKKCKYIETGQEFNSLKEACKIKGVSYGAQKMAIRKKRSTAKFMFIGEEFTPIKRKHPKSKECIFIETGEKFSSLNLGCKVKGLRYSQQLDAINLELTTKLFKWI